jgi:hypothetical protein
VPGWLVRRELHSPRAGKDRPASCGHVGFPPAFIATKGSAIKFNLESLRADEMTAQVEAQRALEALTNATPAERKDRQTDYDRASIAHEMAASRVSRAKFTIDPERDDPDGADARTHGCT